MAVTTSNTATIRGKQYTKGDSFVCASAEYGNSKSEGASGTRSQQLTVGKTYYFLSVASGSSVTHPYLVGSSSSTNSQIGWYKEAVFPYYTYTITYDANGGTGAPSNQTKTHGTSLTLSNTKPTKNGYTFVNWKATNRADGQTPTYNPGETVTYNGNQTLVAQWTPKNYTVSFNANGGSGTLSSQNKEYGIDLILSTTKPTRTGYTFKYWTSTEFDLIDGDRLASVQHFNGNYIKRAWITQVNSTTMEILVYAENIAHIKLPTWNHKNEQDDLVWYTPDAGSWSREGYSFNYGMQININSHGQYGTFSTHIYAYDSSLNELQSVALKDWGFRLYPGETYKANSSGTLYAQWELNKYKVKYDANGGKGAPGEQTKVYGVNLILSNIIPTHDDLSLGFMGWGVSADSTVPAYEPGKEYVANKEITLYAIWGNKSSNCTIYARFQNTEGEFGDYRAVFTTSLQTGMPAIWWYPEDEEYYGTEEFMLIGGAIHTFYVDIYRKKYNIQFNENGGRFAPKNASFYYGQQTMKIPMKRPTRSGYLFLGWSPDSSSSEAEYTLGQAYNNTSPVENPLLYAVWSKKQGYTYFNRDGSLETIELIESNN